MRLKTVELQERAEEAARRQPQAAHKVRAEDDPLALFQRQPDFPLRRGAGVHEVRAGETVGPAEELDVFFLYLRAVPYAGAHGRGRGGGRAHHRGMACSCSRAEEGGRESKMRQGSGEEGRASCATPLPPAYL